MNKEQIIKAWKDDEYRESLGESDRALVPDHPSGLIELSDAQLGMAGGEEEAKTFHWGTFACCNTWGVGCGTMDFKTSGCCVKTPPIGLG